MTNVQKNALIFLFIFFQVTIAILGGLTALYLVTKDRIPPKVYIGSVEVGGLGKEEAAKKIEEHFEKILKNEALVIQLNGTDEFKIKFSDIDTSLDYDSTVKLAYNRKGAGALSNLIDGNLNKKKRVVYPVVSINEGKLRQKLKDLSALVDNEPVNANIYIQGDKIVKVPESKGIKLNLDNSITKLKKEICQYLDKPIEFKSSNNYEIQVVTPRITTEKLEGVDDVIARYSTDIKTRENEDSIRQAASAINKVILYAADVKDGKEAGEFSFNKYLSADNRIVEKNNEGYNQVASTLYAAVIMAGISQDTITRTPHKTAVDYIEPGLDAVVFGNTVDFKFRNTLESNIGIFAEVKDGKITVTLAGKKPVNSVKNSFKIDVEQKYDPPIISVENQDLQPGQKKLISSGKEGLKVNVYRVTLKDEIELSRKLIYTDKYDAVEAIVQVGPNTKWDNKLFK